MNDDLEFVNPIVALLGPFGEVEAKRMFGGFGIFMPA
jgi:TfoX/Sxy family transcriptional regulator of competence genes